MRWTVYRLPLTWPVEQDCLNRLTARLNTGVELGILDQFRREDLEQLFIFWFRRNYQRSDIIHDPRAIAQEFLLWRQLAFL